MKIMITNYQVLLLWLIALIILCINHVVSSAPKAQQAKSTVCPPGTKPNSTNALKHGSAAGCVPLSNRDVSYIWFVSFYLDQQQRNSHVYITVILAFINQYLINFGACMQYRLWCMKVDHALKIINSLEIIYLKIFSNLNILNDDNCFYLIKLKIINNLNFNYFRLNF